MARLNAALRVVKRFHWRCARTTKSNVTVTDPVTGAVLAQLARVRVIGGETHVTGRSDADLVNFSTEIEQKVAAPGADGAFDLSLSGNRLLTLRLGPTGAPLDIALYGAIDRAKNLIRTGLGLLAFLGQWRDIWAYLAQGDSAAGNRLEKRLAPLGTVTFLPQATPGLFTADASEFAEPDPVDIVLPVYQAFEDTSRCLVQLAEHTDASHRVVLIEDASPDPRIAPMLRAWASTRGNVQLVEHEENKGFVASVNEGLMLARGHVVLLNSDAFVPPRWLPRLLAPVLADDAVASVTPMSSDAEIFTAPVDCVRFVPHAGQSLAIDHVAETLNAASATADAPTGVGFCMAMNASFLQKVPQLDTVFGRGYGEEVDWCRKTAALGGRHIGIGNLYVEHRGGGSFGEEKMAHIRANNRIINSRYPGYDESVARFRHHDPMIGPRLALALASIAGDAPVPIFISQRLGGGSEQWLDKEVGARVKGDGGCVVLRQSELEDNAIILEVHCASGVTSGRIEAVELAGYLAVVPRRHLFYSCLVNAEDPLGVMALITGCLKEHDLMTALVHDFFPICPSYNLISNDQRYCGLPDAGTCQQCYTSLPITSGRRPKHISSWRDHWKEYLDRADKIVVFSQDSGAQLRRIWSDLASRIVVQPHELIHQPDVVAAPTSGPFVLGVLGAIGHSKGAAVLKALADHVDDEFKVVIVGKLDQHFAHPALVVNGVYAHEDISKLALKYGVSGWIIPSIWPETFCYSAHECLATKLPVLSFDLGAQGEAVRAHPNGHVLPLETDPKEIKETFLSIVRARRSVA